MSYKRSLSTESSDDDSVKKEDIVPAKRTRTFTTGTSSQYSSASSSAPICESASESESDSPSCSRDQPEPHISATKLDCSVKYTQGSGDEDTPTGSEFLSNGNNPVMKMMSLMGYQPGKGLGKYAQGRTEPVEASTQKGRRGLGLKPSTLGEVPKDFAWRKEAEKIVATEIIEWLPPSDPEWLSQEILEDWLEKGPKKMTIDDETNFVHPDILNGILLSKSVFDDLDAEPLRRARTKSNPYETIGSVMFLNRAAVKMANMDAMFDFMFTEPKAMDGTPFVKKNELLYFADVCAGPGGFSEYVLFRKKWRAKGFGFTLKGSNDFKLSDFFAGSPETFGPYYGKAGNGDIFNPENLDSLRDHVFAQTNEQGVHFLMGDGGFSVDGQENIQEILSKQLYLCQCIAALMLVRPGGNFIVKLFDIFTPFSVGLVYLMYKSFEQVCVHKPHTSRPANSERYLICKWKRPEADVIRVHLFNVNKFLWENRDADDDDIIGLVPMYIMKKDTEFFNYIYNSNNTLGERQINNLLKIAAFCKDKNLTEPSQADMRRECLQLWQLEEKVRTAPRKSSPDDTLNRILSLMQTRPPDSSDIMNFKRNILNKPATRVQEVKHLGLLKGIYDWHFVTMNTDACKFYIGLGGNHVYELDETRWHHLTDTKVMMPATTLLYGEIVKELRGQKGNQMMTRALHVVDAVCLGGEDISHKSLIERHQLCELFCAALDKPFDSSILPIRCKPLMELEKFSREMAQYQFKYMKNGHRAVTTAVPLKGQSDVELYYVVGSLLFLQSLKEPWQATISKTTNTKYFFKPLPNRTFQSEYHRLPEACLDTINSFLKRKIWCWEPASAVYQNMMERTDGLNRSDMEEFVKKYLV